MSAVVLSEGVRWGAVLGVCAIVLAVLGLTPSLSWIPEVPLVAAAVLLPLGILGLTRFLAGLRSRAAVAGALAGCIAGGVGGVSYVLFGKPWLNIAVGLLLGTLGGAAVGAAGAVLGRRTSRHGLDRLRVDSGSPGSTHR